MYMAMFFNSKLLGRPAVLRRLSMYTLHRLTSSLIASSAVLVSTESAVYTSHTHYHYPETAYQQYYKLWFEKTQI